MKTKVEKMNIRSTSGETLQHNEAENGKERTEKLRLRNVHQCRKNRKKWKECDDEMNNLYVENEIRIHQLETMIDKISTELGLSSSTSTHSS